MGSLSNLYISQSFQSLIKLGNDGTITTASVELEDGLGNGLGLFVNSNGDISSSGNFFAANLTGSGGGTIPSGTISSSAQITSLGFVSSSVTASSLITASFNNGNRNLTFTKGDSTTFSVNIPDVSGSAGDFVTTASFNAYTSSTNQRVDSLEINSGSVNVSITNLNSTTGSLNTSISNLNASSASQQVSIDALNTFTASQSTASLVTSINNLNSFSASTLISLTNLNASSASQQISIDNLNINSGSVNISIGALNTFTASQSTASIVNSITQLNTFSASALVSISNINSTTQSLNTSASLGLTTASFDNGSRNLTFTKGNNTQFSVNIPDVSGSTGNFATTGSNTFTGNQIITGSVSVSDTIKSQVYINPQTLNGFTIPTGNNAMLVGPVAVSGSIVVEGNSNLIVLSQVTSSLPSGVVSGSSQLTASYDLRYALSGSGGGTINTGSFATTGSNTFVGNQTITGSLLISSSAGNDLVVEGRMLISGPTSGQTPQFIISGSDSTNTVGRTSMIINTTGSLSPVINVISGSGASSGNQTNCALTSTQITSTDTSISGSTKRIAITANPSKTGIAALSSVIQPSLLGVNNTNTNYQVFELQSQNNFTNGTISFKVPVAVTGSVNISGSISASLQQGHVLVGDSSGRTTTVATSSFGGGTINTGSFATTGSNTFNGNQSITGSVSIKGNTTFTDNSGDKSSVILGNNAMLNSSGSNANQNVAIGENALSVTQEKFNVAIGNDTLKANTTGNQNTAIGFSALKKNTTAGNNFALGASSMFENTTGNQNIAIGVGALYNNVSGSLNVVIGNDAGIQANGSRNVFIGPSSGESITGEGNVIIGAHKGTALELVTNNIILADGSAAGNIRARYNGDWQFPANINVTGSVSIAPTHQVRFATGSNQQAATAVLVAGEVIVSNSLVTANSIILLTKQTFASNHFVAVSSKGAGTFTIESSNNSDTDTVGYFIINNS